MAWVHIPNFILSYMHINSKFFIFLNKLFYNSHIIELSMPHELFNDIYMFPLPCRYVSGYKNRFQNFIRYLREMGDEVYFRITLWTSVI